MLRIGVLKKEYYCEKRNVTDRVNMHEKRAEYVIIKGCDLRACAGVALDKMRKKLRMKGVSPLHSNRLRDYYHPIVSPNVDVIHTCNVVCETKKPWMATFEGAFPLGQREQNLPEQRAWMQRCYQQMAAPSCKRLLAFSNWAADCTREWMRRNNCQQYDEINSKIEVLYPPQPVQLTADEVMAKFQDVNKELRFFFVGRDFYRKGMYECLLALKKLREAYPVHLTIVSGLKQEYVYRVPKYTAQEEAEVQGIIRDNSDWIEYHESLPNEQVLALCKRAHIGLLPTYRDSFGYSTIEMQSCGCVVLSTDIFALPELNDLDIGYVCAIRHAVDALTDGNDAAVQALRPLLAAQLQEQLMRIVEERGKLVDKAQMALARVAQRYDPERHGERLYELYQECGKK